MWEHRDKSYDRCYTIIPERHLVCCMVKHSHLQSLNLWPISLRQLIKGLQVSSLSEFSNLFVTILSK